MARQLLGAGLSVALAGAVMAQDGGRQLSFDLGQRIESQRNPDLSPGGNDTETVAVTNLGMTLSSVTRSDSLVFGLGTSLRLADDQDPEFGRLNARLSYGRTGPDGGLDLTASYSRDEINALRPLDLLLLDTGEILDIDEVEALLRETGIRENLSMRAALSFGTSRPFGGRVSVSASQLRYDGLSSTVDLQDRDSLRVGLDTRFDLSQSIEANLSLAHGWSEEEGADRIVSSSLGGGITFDQPIGALRLGFSVTETEAATRFSVSTGLSRSLANGGNLAFSLGATRTSDDETTVNGSGRYAVALSPNTEIAASLERSVVDDRDGDAQLRTVADFDLSQALSPLSSLALSATAIDRRTPGGDNARFDAELTASYRYQLSEDWGLGLGVTRSYRDADSATDSATSDTVFLSVSRSFPARF